MKVLTTAVAILLVGGASLEAQRPNRENLQQQVMERFLGGFVEAAGLSDDQQRQFGEVVGGFMDRSRDHQRMTRELWQALEGQMRPGVAADVDSVVALTGALIDARSQEGAHLRQLQVEMGEFLTPVQFSQFLLRLERFQRQVESVRGRRGMGRGDDGGRPGGF
jgi:hypothetical protein